MRRLKHFFDYLVRWPWRKIFISVRLVALFAAPAVFIVLFFSPRSLNFTFSPTNNSSTISIYTAQLNNFNQEITRFNFINLQFVTYNLYLQQNIQVLDSEKGVISPGTLLYNNLQDIQQQLSTTTQIEIGLSLPQQDVSKFIDQFGNSVQWIYTITGDHVIPPHSSISFIGHAFIRVIISPTITSYIYLYLFILVALISVIILSKEAVQFVAKGQKYFVD